MNIEDEGAKIIPFPSGKKLLRENTRENTSEGEGAVIPFFRAEGGVKRLTPERRVMWEDILQKTQERVRILTQGISDLQKHSEDCKDYIGKIRSGWEDFSDVIPFDEAKGDVEKIRMVKDLMEENQAKMKLLEEQISDELESLKAVEDLFKGV